MLRFLKNKRERQVLTPVIRETSDVSDNENSLEDENEDLWEHLGSLSVLESSKDGPKDMSVSAPEIDMFTIHDMSRSLTIVPSNIHFEVMDAQIIDSGKSKFVLYTILLRNTNHDLAPVSIERRYSRFEKLHSDMKRKFPGIMQGVMFPKKLLSGNFKAKTIAERSRAFEQYLCHLVMVNEVRVSFPFAPFLYGEDWVTACKTMVNKEYSLAIYMLRKVLEIQKKLLGDIHGDTVLTLCAITVCYINCSNDNQAHFSARLAIKAIHTNDRCEFLVPLLKYCIRLCWSLGRDKQDLEIQLTQLTSKKHFVDKNVPLQDLVDEKIQASLA